MNPFYHVYELPGRAFLANGFCFAGGNPIPFLNVDWFEAPAMLGEVTQEQVSAEVRRKGYYNPSRRYLVLGSPGHTFVIEPTP